MMQREHRILIAVIFLACTVALCAIDGRTTDVLLVPADYLIVSFDPQDGTYLGVFSAWSGLQWPLEAIQGPDGNIYVSDGVACAIFVFDTNGDYLYTYADASDGLTGINYGLAFRGNDLFLCMTTDWQTFSVARFDGPHSRQPDFIRTTDWAYDVHFLDDGSCLITAPVNNKISRYSAAGTWISDVLTGHFYLQVTPDLSPPGDFLTCANSTSMIQNFIREFDITGLVHDDLSPATGIDCWGIHRLGNGNYFLPGQGSAFEIESGTGRVVETELSWGDTRFVGTATLPPPPPGVDIKVNGQDAAVRVKQGTNARMTIDVEARSAAGTPVDVWTAARAGGALFFTYGSDFRWHPGLGNALFTGPLVDMTVTPFDAKLPIGSYKAWLGLDTVPDGNLDLGSILAVDAVDFQVVP